MNKRSVIAAAAAAAICSFASVVTAEDFKMPPEVTPQLRAACESDVRRLCIDDSPTVAKVKRCVAAKFHKLGNRCKLQLAMAGLSR